MDKKELFSKFALLPVVNLNDIHCPLSGLKMKTSKDCTINYHKNSVCKLHYESILNMNTFEIKQCPYGFSTMAVISDKAKIALTGFVPYPRLGGEKETKLAKKYPENKIEIQSIKDNIKILNDVYIHFQKITKDIIDNSSKALHEIRKLNRIVKQTSEKLHARDKENKMLLTIFKAAEMMSQQFDVIELLADENLSKLPLNINSNIFDLFYKCIQINSLDQNRFIFNCDLAYRPKALVCDKTFNIIPSVLISNALKYAIPKSKIILELVDLGNACEVKILNEIKEKLEVNENIFDKGIRFHGDTDGTGNGLYVAQLIAKQHGSIICFRQFKKNENVFVCEFSLKIKTLDS